MHYLSGAALPEADPGQMEYADPGRWELVCGEGGIDGGCGGGGGGENVKMLVPKAEE